MGFIWLTIFLFVNVFPIIAQGSFTELYQEYKKGNYTTVARSSYAYLSGKPSDTDPRIFFLYVATEESWKKLKETVLKETPSHFSQSSHYGNSLFLFMERALVLGEHELVVLAGKKVKAMGNIFPKYVDALLIYSISLFELQNKEEGKTILRELEEVPKSAKQNEYFQEIKGSLRL